MFSGETEEKHLRNNSSPKLIKIPTKKKKKKKKKKSSDRVSLSVLINHLYSSVCVYVDFSSSCGFKLSLFM